MLMANGARQVNSAAAAVMYKLVGEWAGCERDTLVLDVCCGTGTIGISVSGQARSLVCRCHCWKAVGMHVWSVDGYCHLG